MSDFRTTPQGMPGPGPRLDILVLDDDPGLSGRLEPALERLGAVHRHQTWDAALLALSGYPFAVMLVSLGKLSEQAPEDVDSLLLATRDAAVIVMARVEQEAEALKTLGKGVQDYLLIDRIEEPLLACSIRYAMERKKVEQKLQEHERFFSILTNHMLDLLAIIDAEGTRVYASPSYSRLLGFEPAEMERLSLRELVHSEDRERIRAALKSLFESGSSQGIEYRLRRKDGTYLNMESNAVRIQGLSNDRPQAVLVSRDISARKASEAARDRMEIQLRQAQKLEAIGHLAAGIAHEINTPTQYIGDNTNFLKDAFETFRNLLAQQHRCLGLWEEGTLTKDEVARAQAAFDQADVEFLLQEIPKAIGQSLEGVRRVTRIVSAMKDFSHPSGDVKSRADLNRAIESTAAVCRNEWKYVADLELDLAPDLPSVFCFPGELNQAILNLIINAAHAIEAKQSGTKAKGHIRIQTRAIGEEVQILVEDSGCGIPEAIRDRIFDPFFTTKPLGKGTGQGLAIVHAAIVEKHSGSISIDSEVGKGTTFLLRMPVKGD